MTENEYQTYDPNRLVVLKPKAFEDAQTLSVAQIEQNMRTLENLRTSYNIHNNRVEALKEYLADNYDEIGEENVQAIAELFEIDLTKTVNLTITVEFSLSVEVPLNEVDDLNPDDWQWSYSADHQTLSLEDIDYNVTDWSVN